MRLIEKSGTLQILDSLRESSVKEDVSDLVGTEDEILLGSEEEDKKEDKVEKASCEEKEDLKEAEQTIDIFVNPERDYKITDVTMLEPIDDGDVRAIDMQSILIGLDESLTEKYGAKWGEFNIQSSRTPRGKISENDISYVLHVLNINGHQEILNYNTKGIGRIREAFVTDSRGKVLSSKRCAVSRIPKFFMEATENYIERYSDDDNVYTIEVWDSRYDREEGFGYTIGETFKDRDEAIEFARDLFNSEYKECVEVQGPNGGAVLTIGPEGENFWNEDLEESLKESEKINWENLWNDEFVFEIDGVKDWKYIKFFASSNEVYPEDIDKGENLEDYGCIDYTIYNADKEEIDGGELVSKEDEYVPEELAKDCLELGGLIDRNAVKLTRVDSEILDEAAKAIKEDAVLPNNGYIDQTGLNLVSDERIQASLQRRVQRLKARQKLLKAKRTFDKKGNVAPVDEKNTHGKEVADSDIGQETEPITDTKIKESVVTLDTDNGTVDIDGNVSHVTLDQDGTMTAVSGGEIITTTDNSVEVLPSEETMIADDSVLEPVEGEMGAEDIIEPEEAELAPEEAEMAPEDEVVETGDIAMAEPVAASELEEGAKAVKESAEDIDKFWSSDIKAGDKVMSSGAGEVEVLDLNKGADYILLKRNTDFQPFVAAWAPQLNDEGELFWGQGHYFDTEEEARKHFDSKLTEAVKTSKSKKLEEMGRFAGRMDKLRAASGRADVYNNNVKAQAVKDAAKLLRGLAKIQEDVPELKEINSKVNLWKLKDSYNIWLDASGRGLDFETSDPTLRNSDMTLIVGNEILLQTSGSNIHIDKSILDEYGDSDFKRFVKIATELLDIYPDYVKAVNQAIDDYDLKYPELQESLKEAVEEKVESEIEGEDKVIEEDSVPTAIFHRKPSSVDAMRKEEDNKVVTAKSSYVVKDVKEVDEAEYKDLCDNLLKERDYIKAFADSVEADNSVTFNCLEVKGPNGSLLIDPSGYGYARYCAFGSGNVEEPVEEVEAEEVIEEPVEKGE